VKGGRRLCHPGSAIWAALPALLPAPAAPAFEAIRAEPGAQRVRVGPPESAGAAGSEGAQC
jgi:hypothetical protein